jgi:hypothetical protein
VASLFRIIVSWEVIVFLFIIKHIYHLESPIAKEVAIFFNTRQILNGYPENNRMLDIF